MNMFHELSPAWSKYSFSHNHGSGYWPDLKGNCYLFFTSMFMGGRVSPIASIQARDEGVCDEGRI